MSHNRCSIQVSPLQAGGIGILLYGQMAHIGAGAKSDNAKLGQWTWTCHQGKQGTHLWCVSLYRPCPRNAGVSTVAAQHQQYLQTIINDREPCTAFLEDFEVKLGEWLAMGDHVIVGGNLNQNVLDPEVCAIFK